MIIQVDNPSTPKSRDRRKWRQRGASLLEFTLVGIGIIFVLIGTFEISRIMWIYNTLQHAAKEAARFAVVHGKNCSGACVKTQADVANFIREQATGLDTNNLQIRLAVGCEGSPDSADPATPKGCSTSGGTGGVVSYSTVAANTTNWPGENGEYGFAIEVELRYSFPTALAFFWTGVGPGTVYGNMNLVALAREMIEY